MKIVILAELIERLIHLLHIEEEAYRKSSDLKTLSPTQIHYIDMINHEANPTLSELAAKLKVSKPSVTNHVDKLEKMGHLIKIESDQDRRIQHVHLTAAGKAIAVLHDRFHEVFTEKLVGKLSGSEIKQLESLLTKALE